MVSTMKKTENITDKIYHQLRILQNFAWAQTIIFGMSAILAYLQIYSIINAIFFLIPHVTLLAWLTYSTIFSLILVTAPWISFMALQLYKFKFIRWINWHVATLTLLVFFVFISVYFSSKAAMYGALAGMVYTAVSANIFTVAIQRMLQNNNHGFPARIQIQHDEKLDELLDNFSKFGDEKIQDAPTMNRYDRFVLAKQEEQKAKEYFENITLQAGKKPLSYRRHLMGIYVGMPLLLPFMLPIQPLDTSPILRIYVESIANVIPAVATFYHLDAPYAQLAATVNAILWPPVFIAIVYLLIFFITPFIKMNKNMCIKFNKARKIYLAMREQSSDILKGQSSNPSRYSDLWIFFIGLMFVAYVTLSNLNAIPAGAPAFGPLAGNGFFSHALINRYAMSFISCVAVVIIFVTYAFIPIALAGKLICFLKTDSKIKHSDPLV